MLHIRSASLHFKAGGWAVLVLPFGILFLALTVLHHPPTPQSVVDFGEARSAATRSWESGLPRGIPSRARAGSSTAPARLMLHLVADRLHSGAPQQGCVFFEFPDGKVGRRSQEALVPSCDSMWRTRWGVDTRALSLAQQLALDLRCPTQWSASGGSVSTSGVYFPAPSSAGHSLVATSPDGPCLAEAAELTRVVHRRWRVTHLPGGVIHLAIDPQGEWNTTADLLASRLESQPGGAPVPPTLVGTSN